MQVDPRAAGFGVRERAPLRFVPTVGDVGGIGVEIQQTNWVTMRNSIVRIRCKAGHRIR